MEVGLIFPPDQPPEALLEVARAAEDAGIPELWLWEDCFAESGIACAAAALAATDHLRVGIGLMPVPLRNVALTAMEVATLARMFPGRLLPGIGHGVLEWMGQAGVRADSPLTLLREYAVALRRLLDGEQVTAQGRYVRLDRVQLRHPVPDEQRVPLFMGGARPKTLALAGQLGDGLVYDQSVERLPELLGIALDARADAGRPDPFDVVAFCSVPIDSSAALIAERLAALAAAGATRIPVCAVSAAGPPESGPALMDFAATVAEAIDDCAPQP